MSQVYYFHAFSQEFITHYCATKSLFYYFSFFEVKHIKRTLMSWYIWLSFQIKEGLMCFWYIFPECYCRKWTLERQISEFCGLILVNTVLIFVLAKYCLVIRIPFVTCCRLILSSLWINLKTIVLKKWKKWCNKKRVKSVFFESFSSLCKPLLWGCSVQIFFLKCWF